MSTQNTSPDLPDELQPCGHMVNLVSRRSDDSLKGPAKWYTDFHVMTCPNCRTALMGLRHLRQEVSELAGASKERLTLSDEKWTQIEEALKN